MGLTLVFAPVMVLAQAKPAEKNAPAKPAMQHDMSAMGHDTAMKRKMSTMRHDTGMKHHMAGMGMGMGMGAMKSGWGELDAFHALLMAVWHPAQNDSLAMARSLAPTLVASAIAWEKSKGPAACDNAAARKALPGIVTDARTYANVAATKANDAAVKAALKKVHDGFETVGKPCIMAAMGRAPGAKKPMDAMDHSKMDHSAPPKKP